MWKVSSLHAGGPYPLLVSRRDGRLTRLDLNRCEGAIVTRGAVQ